MPYPVPRPPPPWPYPEPTYPKPGPEMVWDPCLGVWYIDAGIETDDDPWLLLLPGCKSKPVRLGFNAERIAMDKALQQLLEKRDMLQKAVKAGEEAVAARAPAGSGSDHSKCLAGEEFG